MREIFFLEGKKKLIKQKNNRIKENVKCVRKKTRTCMLELMDENQADLDASRRYNISIYVHVVKFD